MSASNSSQSRRIALREAAASRLTARRPVTHASPEAGSLPASWPGAGGRPVQESVAIGAGRRPGFVLRDRLIGLGVAAALHLGVLFGFNSEPKPAAVGPAEPEETVILLEMPVLEPPEIIEVVDMTDAPTAPQIAPPMLMDMPSTMVVANFVQPVRPTLDPSLTSVGAITIPSVVATIGTGSAVRLFDLKELDRVPRRVRTVMPVYPHELRRSGITGEVSLIVIIDVNGRVTVERVVSATAREFEAAAVKAAELCVFEPPLRAGQRVNARYAWQIPFELR